MLECVGLSPGIMGARWQNHSHLTPALPVLLQGYGLQWHHHWPGSAHVHVLRAPVRGCHHGESQDPGSVRGCPLPGQALTLREAERVAGETFWTPGVRFWGERLHGSLTVSYLLWVRAEQPERKCVCTPISVHIASANLLAYHCLFEDPCQFGGK